MKKGVRVHNRPKFIKASTGLAAGFSILPAVKLLGLAPDNLSQASGEQRNAAILPPWPGGELIFDPALVAAFNDFGNIIHRTPKAISGPGSQSDIIKTIRYAYDNKLRTASRGAGHTAFGQSQVDRLTYHKY